MAHNSGEISTDELKKRGAVEPFAYQSDSPLKTLAERHESADIQGHSNSIMPTEISTQLIAAGHMPKHIINEALSQSSHFNPPEEIPIWRRAWDWRDLPPIKAEALVSDLIKKLKNLQIIEPGELLHIYCSLNHLAKVGGITQSTGEIEALIISTIDNLQSANMLPLANYKNGNRNAYGIDFHSGGVSYGGWHFEITPEMREVINHLKTTMARVFEQTVPTIAKDMIAVFEQHPEQFIEMLENENGAVEYPTFPIFSYLDHAQVSKFLFEHFQTNQQTAEAIGAAIRSRLRHGQPELDADRAWAKSVARSFIELAAKHSLMAEAKAKSFAKQYLGFNAEEEEVSD